MSTHADDSGATTAGEQPVFLPPVTPAAADKPVTATRPELVVAAAFAGGIILAKLLGRARDN